MAPALKPYRFEYVEEGEEFGPIELLVDDHAIKSYAFAADDYNPWYFSDDTPFGFRVAPPVPIGHDLGNLVFATKYDTHDAAGLHQKEELWFHGPVPLGARLTLTGTYVEKYVRRGKGYMVMEATARDEKGDVLIRHRGTGMTIIPAGIHHNERAGEPEGRRVAGVWPAGRSQVLKANLEVAPGSPLPPSVRCLYQDQMAVFSGASVHWRNFHTDLEMAHKAGFPTTVGQGMMATCWCSEMLAEFYGPSWFTSGWIYMAYVRPIYCGDTITSRAVVTGPVADPAGPRLEVELWCENQRGVMTAAGWASARLK
ncbi:MAG: MaoC family dehydratase [Chloroflexota bacterium]